MRYRTKPKIFGTIQAGSSFLTGAEVELLRKPDSGGFIVKMLEKRKCYEVGSVIQLGNGEFKENARVRKGSTK